MADLWFLLLWLMLAIYVALDGFDLGAGILHPWIGRTEPERRQILRSIGPVWDGNEVWLIAAGGTMVLAFPKFYAAAFSGFYLPLMVVLWLLMGRALGIELRHHLKDPLWRQFWDGVFAVSSLLLTIVFGAALANIVRGVPLDAHGRFFEPLWTDFTIGPPTGILDWYTLTVGLAAAVVLAHHGALWLAARTDGRVAQRARRAAAGLWWATLGAFGAVTACSAIVQPLIGRTLREHPIAALPVGIAVVAVWLTGWLARRGRFGGALLASGVFLVALIAAAVTGVTPYALPGQPPESGLTIAAAASSAATLRTALWWWIPGVLLASGYFVYLYRSLPRVVRLDDHAEH